MLCRQESAGPDAARITCDFKILFIYINIYFDIFFLTFSKKYASINTTLRQTFAQTKGHNDLSFAKKFKVAEVRPHKNYTLLRYQKAV